jgi:hypothetical protein
MAYTDVYQRKLAKQDEDRRMNGHDPELAGNEF